jgi:hypothetical protein
MRVMHSNSDHANTTLQIQLTTRTAVAPAPVDVHGMVNVSCHDALNA